MTEWEEFKHHIDNFDPEAGPMPEEQFKRFQELIWTAQPPTRKPDTKTLEKDMDFFDEIRQRNLQKRDDLLASITTKASGICQWDQCDKQAQTTVTVGSPQGEQECHFCYAHYNLLRNGVMDLIRFEWNVKGAHQ